MTSDNYRLEHLTENLTEEGITAIREYLESNSTDVDGLSTFLFETSTWFAHACVEYSNQLALIMVEEYLAASGKLLEYYNMQGHKRHTMEKDFKSFFLGEADSDLPSI